MLAAQMALGKTAPDPLFDMWAQRLDEVTGERLATALGDMQEAEQWVEPDDLDLAHGLVVEQGVAERQTDVDRIGRRSPAAPGKFQRVAEERRIGAKIGGRTRTLEPSVFRVTHRNTACASIDDN
jgi:hypothetical protein